MNGARDFNVQAENIRLIEKRKEEQDLLLWAQYREAVHLAAREQKESTEEIAIHEVVDIFGRISGKESLISPQFALFCSEYSRFFGRSFSLKRLMQSEETEVSEDAGRAVYLKSLSADRAYRTFSSRLDGLTAAYSQSYAASCEEVYYGRSLYVILPIYNSGDGSLLTFRRMLGKYDLKITWVCSVEMDEGDFVLYALARKGLYNEKGSYMDVSVILPDDVAPSDFLKSCEVFGLKPLLINSVPLYYDSDSFGKHELNLHFSSENAHVTDFILFLEASHIRYNVEGIYNIIK